MFPIQNSDEGGRALVGAPPPSTRRAARPPADTRPARGSPLARVSERTTLQRFRCIGMRNPDAIPLACMHAPCDTVTSLGAAGVCHQVCSTHQLADPAQSLEPLDIGHNDRSEACQCRGLQKLANAEACQCSLVDTWSGGEGPARQPLRLSAPVAGPRRLPPPAESGAGRVEGRTRGGLRRRSGSPRRR